MIPQDDINQIEERFASHHRRPEGNKQKMILRLRNILNIIFMIGAIIGVGYYLKVDHTTGIYIIFASMIFKFIESAIRLLKV